MAAKTASVATQGGAARAAGAPEPERLFRGWRLDLARFTWLVVCFAGIICFISGLPRSFAIASDLSPATVRRMAQMGLPASFNAWYLIILDSITFTLFVTAALIIFRKRSNALLGFSAAYMLLFTGMLYTAPSYEARVPITIVALGAAAAEITQILFLLVFPDGHFRPRWTRFLLPPLAVWRFYIWRVYYIPWLYAAHRTGDRYPFLRQDARDLLCFFVIVLIAVALQILRYRRYSSPAQKQQAKWLVWATSMAVLIVGSYVIAINLLPTVHPRMGSNVVLGLAGRTVRQAALTVIPVSILYSVLRYRLWNIDFLINRTLVYVPLTSLLAGGFALVATLTQRFMVATTGTTSDWATVFITVVLATLVSPLRTEIQKWVDYRFKEAPDPLQALKRFDDEVRAVADVLAREPLLSHMVDATVRALGAGGGAAYAAESDGPHLLYATPEWYGPIALQRPLISNGQCAGWFALGARHNGSPYTEAEIKRLDESMQRVALLLVLVHGTHAVETVALAPDTAEPALPLPAHAPTHPAVEPSLADALLGPAEAQPA